MKLPSNLGMTLLAIYLILVGAVGVFEFSLGRLSILMPILALISGILLLLGR